MGFSAVLMMRIIPPSRSSQNKVPQTKHSMYFCQTKINKFLPKIAVNRDTHVEFQCCKGSKSPSSSMSSPYACRADMGLNSILLFLHPLVYVGLYTHPTSIPILQITSQDWSILPFLPPLPPLPATPIVRIDPRIGHILSSLKPSLCVA